MRKNSAQAALVLLAFAAFLLTAGLAELPVPFEQKSHDFISGLILRFAGGTKTSLSYLIYCLVHMVALGAALPLFLAKKFKLIPFSPVTGKRFALGLGLLLGGLAAGMYSIGGWESLTHPPRLEWSMKSFFMGAQLGISQTIYAFFIIPAAVRRLFSNKQAGITAALIASASAAWAIFFAETTLGGNPVPQGVLIAVIPFALGTPVSGSIYLTAAHAVVLYSAALLPLRHYHIISYRPLHAGFLLMFCMGCMYLSTRCRRVFPPRNRPAEKN